MTRQALFPLVPKLELGNERNQSLHERFQLTEAKAESISRIIADAVEEGLVELDDPENKSRRYAKYLPYWV